MKERDNNEDNNNISAKDPTPPIQQSRRQMMKVPSRMLTTSRLQDNRSNNKSETESSAQEKEIMFLRDRVRHLEMNLKQVEDEADRLRKQNSLISYGPKRSKEKNDGKSPKLLNSFKEQARNTFYTPIIVPIRIIESPERKKVKVSETVFSPDLFSSNSESSAFIAGAFETDVSSPELFSSSFSYS